MANTKVTIIRVCKTADGWKRYPVVFGKNGQIRRNYVWVGTEQRHYPEGYFVLRTYQGKQTKYHKAGDGDGTDVTVAVAAYKKLVNRLIVEEHAAEAGIQISADKSERKNLAAKSADYMLRQQGRGKMRAAVTGGQAIRDFLEITGHTYADQITEESILRYYGGLQKRRNGNRTLYNKHVSLFGFFKWLGLDTEKLAEKPPTYTEREVEVYAPEDLAKLFSVCTPYQRLALELLLRTGLRMQELIFLEWTNVDYRAKRLKVRERNENGSFIKDRAERSVPCPSDLLARLEAWHQTHPGGHLALPTRNGTPNRKLLQMLKRLAKRAGLNCGRCGCEKSGECHNWTLKKFRASYTTRTLQGGLDVRTVMSHTGHSDLATVMKYLAPAKEVQEKVEAMEWYPAID